MADPLFSCFLRKSAAGAVSSALQGETSGKRVPASGERPVWFAVRTTVAALTALTVADALQTGHPWWAAMTVWLVAQPTRGLLLERVLARFAGSVAGAAAGAAILLALAGAPLPSLAALALWLMLCAGVGSQFRHFRNYACVLAGYTAVIIVLSALADGLHGNAMAGERVICTMIGIVCATLASLGGLPVAPVGQLSGRLDRLLQRCLDRVEYGLCEGGAPSPPLALLAEIAAVERDIDNDTAGAPGGRHTAWQTRNITGLLLELIALTPLTPTSGERRPGLIASGQPGRDRVAALAARCSDLTAAHTPPATAAALSLGPVLHELSAILHPTAEASLQKRGGEEDLASALLAALRPATALLLASAIWWCSGWEYGAVMVMTAALFSVLFSAHERGNEALIHVLIGTLLGALGGTLTALFLLPHAGHFAAVLLCVTPFLALGAGLMRRPLTARMAIDMNMTFLLTAQPGSPFAGAAHALNQSAAIILGVLVAGAIYWLCLPATPGVHRRRRAQRIVSCARAVYAAQTFTGATAAHHRLRCTLATLLPLCHPTDRVFVLALACLARSRPVLVHRAGGTAPNSILAASAGEALYRALAALSTYVTSPSIDDRN